MQSQHRDAEADYLLAVKDNQPTLHADIKSYFETAPSGEVEQVQTVGKDHGRIEVRTHTVSHVVDWYAAPRSYPGAPRLPTSVDFQRTWIFANAQNSAANLVYDPLGLTKRQLEHMEFLGE